MKKKALSYVWKDPVFSATIAGIFSIVLYNVLVAILKKISFKNALEDFLTMRLELWILLVLILLVIVSYLLFKKLANYKYEPESLTLDKNLFIKIKSKLLPENNLIRWLRMHDFGVGFKHEKLIRLGKITEEDRNPDFEFFHPELEKRKKHLINSLEEFLSAMTSNIFGNENNLLSIPAEWEFENPVRLEMAIKETEEKRKVLCECYDELMRTGRRILKI